MTPLMIGFSILVGLLFVVLMSLSCYSLWCNALNIEVNPVVEHILDKTSVIMLAVLATALTLLFLAVIVTWLLTMLGV